MVSATMGILEVANLLFPVSQIRTPAMNEDQGRVSPFIALYFVVQPAPSSVLNVGIISSSPLRCRIIVQILAHRERGMLRKPHTACCPCRTANCNDTTARLPPVLA